MTVYLVGAGPGDPGLLTRRGAALLSTADVVVHDRLVDPSILTLARPGAQLVDVGKRPTHPAPADPAPVGSQPGGSRAGSLQAGIHQVLIGHARQGRTVVRLKGGDPFVFGRGGEEVEALRAAGVEVEVVAGVSSAFAVPAEAGVPVTHRGLSTSVTVVAGHGGEGGGDGTDWASLARAGGTIVVLMGVAPRERIAVALQKGGMSPDTPVLAVQWGTTPARLTVRTTLGRLGAEEVGSPAVIVVGAVAGLDLAGAVSPPLGRRTVVVTRPRDRSGALVAALESVGARVLAVPLIEVGPPVDGGAALGEVVAGISQWWRRDRGAPHPSPAPYRWIVFTSVNAVDRTLDAVADLRALGSIRLAAVGRATAGALRRRGLEADLVPTVSTALGLADELPAPAGEPPTGSGVTGPVAGRVLFPRAEQARPELAAALRAKGWEVDEVVAYRTGRARPPEGMVADALWRADFITLASPSAVTSLTELRAESELARESQLARESELPGQAGPAGHLPPELPPLVCIGPATAEAVRRAGLAVAVEARTASSRALVEALVAHVAADRD